MHYLASFERKAQVKRDRERTSQVFQFPASATVWGIAGLGGGAFATGRPRGFGNVGDENVVSGAFGGGVWCGQWVGAEATLNR